jgi:hypothetical protein
MPRAGETSDASNAPSFFWMAVRREAINSLPRGSLQNAGMFAGTGVPVSTEIGVIDGAEVNVRKGVSDGRAVGGGGASTGTEHAARVNSVRIKTILFIFILSTKKLAFSPVHCTTAAIMNSGVLPRYSD